MNQHVGLDYFRRLCSFYSTDLVPRLVYLPDPAKIKFRVIVLFGQDLVISWSITSSQFSMSLSDVCAHAGVGLGPGLMGLVGVGATSGFYGSGARLNAPDPPNKHIDSNVEPTFRWN